LSLKRPRLPCKDIDLKKGGTEESPNGSNLVVDTIRTVWVPVGCLRRRIKNSGSCRFHPHREIGCYGHVAGPDWAAKVMFLSISAAAVLLIPMYRTCVLMELHFPKVAKGWDC
jgi:hypothetical protein